MRTAINSGEVTASHLIDSLGGTARVSTLLGIKPPSVSDWRSSNSIPDDKLIRLATVLELETQKKINRQFLFPDDWRKLWPELANNEKCSCQP